MINLKLEGFLENLVNTLKDDEFFLDIRIINAFPRINAPVRLSRETVAVGFSEIKLDSVSVDEDNCAGDVCVFVDIFIPLKYETERLNEIFTRICRCFFEFNILSISADKTVVDGGTASYVMKTKFNFNCGIEVV